MATGLWDTCLDKAFCCGAALNLKWGQGEEFFAHGTGQGEVPGGLVLLNSAVQNGNSVSSGTLWVQVKQK